MSIEKLIRLQKNINEAEKEYKENPTDGNSNKLIIATDEAEIYLNMNKYNLKKSDICEKEIS